MCSYPPSRNTRARSGRGRGGGKNTFATEAVGSSRRHSRHSHPGSMFLRPCPRTHQGFPLRVCRAGVRKEAGGGGRGREGGEQHREHRTCGVSISSLTKGSCVPDRLSASGILDGLSTSIISPLDVTCAHAGRSTRARRTRGGDKDRKKKRKQTKQTRGIGEFKPPIAEEPHRVGLGRGFSMALHPLHATSHAPDRLQRGCPPSRPPR